MNSSDASVKIAGNIVEYCLVRRAQFPTSLPNQYSIAEIIQSEIAPLLSAALAAYPFAWGMSQQVGATPGNTDAVNDLKAELEKWGIKVQ